MATLQEMLAEAIDARHKLTTGTKAVSLQFGERRIGYAEVTLFQLKALDNYIADLRREIAGKPLVRNRIRHVVPD